MDIKLAIYIVFPLVTMIITFAICGWILWKYRMRKTEYVDPNYRSRMVRMVRKLDMDVQKWM